MRKGYPSVDGLVPGKAPRGLTVKPPVEGSSDYEGTIGQVERLGRRGYGV